MPADQVTTQDEEKIDADPPEAIDTAGQFESKKRGMVNDDHHNGERAEKIEAGLSFATLKARIDFELYVVSLRPRWQRCFQAGSAAESASHQT